VLTNHHVAAGQLQKLSTPQELWSVRSRLRIRQEAAVRAARRYVDRQRSLDLSTPMNFVTTNDVIDGNSGSPVINRNGEFVGIIFDGNIESLAGHFVYSEDRNRAVAVHSAVILEALRKLHDTNTLANELVPRDAGSTKQ
jgi:hypothetical protein